MATVLIVDDEFGIAELLDAVLSDDGHTVVTAANGRQGLARVAAGRPDLIFLDFMMPVMDGPAMLAALNADPETRGIPVVLMSSMPEDTVRERAAGHVAFLRKPFRLRQVHDLVARLLAERPEDR